MSIDRATRRLKIVKSRDPCRFWHQVVPSRFCVERVMALIFFGMVSFAIIAHGGEKPALRPPWWERSHVPLSPEIENALSGLEAKMVPLRRAEVADYMDGVVGSLIAATELVDETKKKALKDAASAAVAEAMKPWPAALRKVNRVRLTANGAVPSIAMMNHWNADLAAVARLVLGCKLPDEQPAWAEALKTNLSADQLVKWEGVAAGKREEREKMITTLVKGWYERSRVKGMRLAEEQIKVMSAELKLDEARMSQLSAAAVKIVDRICKEEVARATESLRFVVDKRLQASFRQGRGTFDGYEMEMTPLAEREWLEAVARIIRPEELVKWETYIAEEKARTDKAVAAVLKGSVERLSPEWQKGIDAELSNLSMTLDLSAERAKTLESKAKAAVERTEKAYTRIAKKVLDQMNSSDLAGIVNEGAYYMQLDAADLPENDLAFKEAVAQILSPDERQRLATALEDRKERRVQVMGQILICELDRNLSFTADQRERLLPVAKKLVVNAAKLFPENRRNDGSEIDMGTFYTAGLAAKNEELREFLDQVQIARWHELCKSGSTGGGRTGSANEESKKPAKEPQRKPKPEDVEVQISEYMQQKSEKERARLLAIMIAKAEDATRVAGLPAETSAYLTTAARGAVERTLIGWKSSADQRLRSYIQGATPANIKQRLASLDGYYYERNDDTSVTKQSVWNKAVSLKLTKDEFAAWQKEVDLRAEFRLRTESRAVLADLDRRIALSTAQWEKLEPKILKLVKEYGEDIQEYFSGQAPWYLQYYSTLLPLAGIPEKELKTILSKSQWDDFAADGLGNALSYWSGIEANHRNRAKQ